MSLNDMLKNLHLNLGNIGIGDPQLDQLTPDQVEWAETLFSALNWLTIAGHASRSDMKRMSLRRMISTAREITDSMVASGKLPPPLVGHIVYGLNTISSYPKRPNREAEDDLLAELDEMTLNLSELVEYELARLLVGGMLV
jgi:hypothetical protein